jgi:membrane protease YdiL (CAAX protease family)
MTDSQLESTGRAEGASGSSDAADGGLVEAPWSVSSALSLVIVAFVGALLAGALVAELRGTGWDPVFVTAVSAGIFLLLYAALLGIVWGAASARGVTFVDAVGLRRVVGLRWYGAAAGAAVAGWLFSAAFTAALTALGVRLPREDVAVFRLLPSGPVGLAFTVLLLVVVAPFAEEVVYRGVLLSALSDRWGAVAGLGVSTAVFSLVHVSLGGFVPLVVAGALFGLLFIRSRSLWVAIAAHSAYNALGVAALFASKASGVW